MNKSFLIIGFQILLFSACSKENVEVDEYCVAEIDGEKFKATWLYANGKISTDENLIYLFASNYNIREIDYQNLPVDFKLLNLIFENICIAPGIYKLDQWISESSCYWCSFEFFDSTSISNQKAIATGANVIGGFLKIQSIEFQKDTIINGNFEIIGRNYNNFEFTDTINIKNGSFKFKLRNN